MPPLRRTSTRVRLALSTHLRAGYGRRHERVPLIWVGYDVVLVSARHWLLVASSSRTGKAFGLLIANCGLLQS